MLFETEQVRQFLPHRDPFIFVDSIESVSHPKHKKITLDRIAGVRVIGHYYTKKDHPIFKGHFPDRPILPGVIQIEMMAQICSFTVSSLEDIDLGKGPEMALLGVTAAKFRRPITPEMQLRIETTCIKPRGSIMTFDCKVYHNNDLMSQCSVTAFMPCLKNRHSLEYEEKQSHL